MVRRRSGARFSSGVRQNVYPNPARKHMEVFQNFSGGMNSVTANDSLADSEFPMLKNVDLKERGSISRRSGFIPYLLPNVTGKGQGYFRYYRGTTDYDEILAINGKLYKDKQELKIEGLEDGFQTERPVEAVQFGNKLYIATGTKLVEYDGEKAKVVEPYKPQPLEGLYVGLNALAENPYDFMQDGVSSVPTINGVTLDKRYGVVGQPVRARAWVSVPQDMELEYKFSRRFSSHKEGDFPYERDWSTSKEYTFHPEMDGDMTIRVQMRDKNDPTEEYDGFDGDGNPKKLIRDKVISEYYVPRYVVKAAPDPTDEDPDVSSIHECNRILLHWNRLILYGDPKNPDMIYISHLNRGDYFPINNTLRFTNAKQEGISKIVQYRDMLVVFTPSTIQALFGTNPADYRRTTLNSDIGAIAPESVQVMENYIAFLSAEGVYVLKSVGQVMDKANVAKIDTLIENLIPRHTNATAVVYDNQYHITFPSERISFRYYFVDDVWVMDESERMNFDRYYIYDTFLFAQNRETGHVVVFRDDVFNDEGYVYEMRMDSKYFDFGEPYNPKKLKEFQLLLMKDKFDESVNVYVYADKERVWNVSEDDEISDRSMWKIGKAYYENPHSAVYRLRLSGKCRQTKVVLTQKDNKPFHVYGFGYKFKVKAP